MVMFSAINETGNEEQQPQHSVSEFVMKGLSLGYDLSTVLFASQRVSHNESMSKFVQILINCEDEKRRLKQRLKNSDKINYSMTMSTSPKSFLIIDGIDTIFTYYNGDKNISMKPVYIAYRTLETFNLGKCMIILNDTIKAKSCNTEEISFLHKLSQKGNVILVNQTSGKAVISAVSNILTQRSIIFSNGYSKQSIANFKTKLISEKPSFKIDFASFHFNNDEFIVDDIVPLNAEDNEGNSENLTGQSGITNSKQNQHICDDPCPYGTKCTYGNKCKYYHPERKIVPQLSLIDELTQKAIKEKSKLDQSVKEKGSLSAIMLDELNMLLNNGSLNTTGDVSVGRFQITSSTNEHNSDVIYREMVQQRGCHITQQNRSPDNLINGFMDSNVSENSVRTTENKISSSLSKCLSNKLHNKWHLENDKNIDSSIAKRAMRTACYSYQDSGLARHPHYINQDNALDDEHYPSNRNCAYFTWSGPNQYLNSSCLNPNYNQQHSQMTNNLRLNNNHRSNFHCTNNQISAVPSHPMNWSSYERYSQDRLDQNACRPIFSNIPMYPYATIHKSAFINRCSRNNRLSDKSFNMKMSKPGYYQSHNTINGPPLETTDTVYNFNPSLCKRASRHSQHLNSSTSDFGDSLTYSTNSPYSRSLSSSQSSGIDISTSMSDISLSDNLTLTNECPDNNNESNYIYLLSSISLSENDGQGQSDLNSSVEEH
ncbi:hypothetical protein GJ496_006799 [Pomphorhynchus laevis]|nr:hypothetical protein GJ496_006799 [Pomphorhynchus laevis]